MAEKLKTDVYDPLADKGLVTNIPIELRVCKNKTKCSYVPVEYKVSNQIFLFVNSKENLN